MVVRFGEFSWAEAMSIFVALSWSGCLERSCGCVDANQQVAIAAAGAIEPLIVLLGSPSEGVQTRAAGCLENLALNGARQ